MAGLISSAEAVSIRDALSVFLVHRCVLTPQEVPVLDGDGNPVLDDWGNPTYTTGTPVEDVPCRYRAEDTVRIDDQGTVLRRLPTLTVAHDLSVTVNDTVTDVTDSDGAVLLDGPAVVEAIVASAGFGPTLQKRLVLRASGVET
jgi:hypothetical protein